MNNEQLSMGNDQLIFFDGTGLLYSYIIWESQLYKGLNYFSDFDSGLWAVKLGGEEVYRCNLLEF